MGKDNIPLIRVEDMKKYYPVKGGIITHTTGYVKAVDGVPVTSLFDTKDLPGYASYSQEECPLCRQGLEVDAVVDKFGYSLL